MCDHRQCGLIKHDTAIALLEQANFGHKEFWGPGHTNFIISLDKIDEAVALLRKHNTPATLDFAERLIEHKLSRRMESPI